MKLNQFQKKILNFLGLRLSNLAVNVLLKTIRLEIKNGDAVNKLFAEKKNFVAASWHGSMMIGWYLHRKKNFSALVSKSKDGDILANVLEKWNYKIIRGSSHIGGKKALELMLDLIKQKFSVAITPDGPTGPRHKMKAGAVVASKKSNVPLFLVGIGIRNKFVMKSWDSFEVPKPFSKVVVVYSDPISIDANLSYEETDQRIHECEALLNKLQKEALLFC